MSEIVLEREQTDIEAAVEEAAEAAAPAPAAPPALARRAAPLTLEHASYALALAVALALRLAGLAGVTAAPLHPHEAASAWPAWLAASGQSVAHVAPPDAALLSSVQTALFFLLGAHDSLARLLPALAGGALVLLPWLWRDRLGRGAALILAFLLALDPWLLGLSRSGGSSVLSAALGLLALGALHRLAAPPAARGTAGDGAGLNGRGAWPGVAAPALGLLLVSGPQAWGWLGVIALYVLIDGRAALLPLAAWRPWAAAAGVSLLAATAFLWQPAALAQVGGSLGAWLAIFAAGPYGVGWPWLRLLVDQPFVFVFGLAGLAGLLRRTLRRRAGRGEWFLLAWLAWAALLLLLPGRTPFALPLLGVPLALLAARALAALAGLRRAQDDWREGALLAGVLAVLGAATLFWFAGLVWGVQWSALPAQVVALLAGVAVLAILGYALWMDRRQALLIAAGLSALALLGASLSSAWRLAYRADASRPDGFYAVLGHPAARLLAQDVARISAIRTGDPTELAVQVETGPGLAPDAQVGWELRAMRNLTWQAVPAPPGDVERTRAPLLVTGPVVEAGWPLRYVGASYTLRTAWLPGEQLPSLRDARGQEGGAQAAWAAAVRPWLRWLIYRDARPPALPPVPEQVVLWAAE